MKFNFLIYIHSFIHPTNCIKTVLCTYYTLQYTVMPVSLGVIYVDWSLEDQFKILCIHCFQIPGASVFSPTS